MKAELEIVSFDVSDIVTTSGCIQPDVPTDFGGDKPPECDKVVIS